MYSVMRRSAQDSKLMMRSRGPGAAMEGPGGGKEGDGSEVIVLSRKVKQWLHGQSKTASDGRRRANKTEKRIVKAETVDAHGNARYLQK